MGNKLDKEQLVPGAIVMVGPSKNPNGTIDRSWCDAIWRIEATTGNAVLCRRMSKLIGYADVITMRATEHEWFEAEHMLEAYRTALKETAHEYQEVIKAHRAEAEGTRQKTSVVF